jgi:hypothetical protein
MDSRLINHQILCVYIKMCNKKIKFQVKQREKEEEESFKKLLCNFEIFHKCFKHNHTFSQYFNELL